MPKWILPVIFLVLIAALAFLVNAQAAKIERLTKIIEGASEPQRESSGNEAEQEDPDETGGITGRLASLESEVYSLRSRLNRCEFAVRSLDDGATGGGAGGRRLAGGAPGADENRLEYTILELLDSEKGEVRQRLRDVIREEGEALREQRSKQREQRWRERTEAVLDQLADEARLDEEVRQGILDLLQGEWEQIRGVFRAARADDSFGEAREKALILRRTTDSQVRELLDEDQYNAYRKMREEELGQHFGQRRGRQTGRGGRR